MTTKESHGPRSCYLLTRVENASYTDIKSLKLDDKAIWMALAPDGHSKKKD
ncbi:hypothetical protein RGR602_CH03320 [Rhizobium gallicum bv. gallicum R602sp]|uniref:Uncharacterized protein n=1 Tax=Rhizobium gallicum bv. gallicum R602sp TaxID=1041138 RepID=A0A0B4X3C1_9HYPH|nr:hypothetical protein RGR602_CH03320 [Rhizobium gallicum bv. gallicum R602sp]